jgi:hypothetical protein
MSAPATCYRPDCGTYHGLLLHQARNEKPCPECIRGEAVRRIEPEGIPCRPSPVPAFGPVTPDQAKQNRDILLKALGGG